MPFCKLTGCYFEFQSSRPWFYWCCQVLVSTIFCTVVFCLQLKTFHRKAGKKCNRQLCLMRPVYFQLLLSHVKVSKLTWICWAFFWADGMRRRVPRANAGRLNCAKRLAIPIRSKFSRKGHLESKGMSQESRERREWSVISCWHWQMVGAKLTWAGEQRSYRGSSVDQGSEGQKLKEKQNKTVMNNC